MDLARYQDPLTIQRVLLGARTIAIVGLSANQLRASNFVGFYLKRHGYRVIPVNPLETEILGEASYSSLSDVPDPVDVVNVFRAPDALPAIAREAVAIKAGARPPRALNRDRPPRAAARDSRARCARSRHVPTPRRARDWPYGPDAAGRCRASSTRAGPFAALAGTRR
jgi:predicted CoA-binding protein